MARAGLKIAAVVLILAAAAVLAWLVWSHSLRPVDRFISEQREKIARSSRLEYVEKLEGPIADKKYRATIYTNVDDTLAMEYFDGRYYVGASGGLIEYDGDLSPAALYTSLNGLRQNHITALKVFKDDLYIGLKSGGLMKLSNGRLTSYAFTDPAAMNVTDLLVINDFLFIGTFGAGVIVFDGGEFSLRIDHMAGAGFKNVTSLSEIDARLAVATHDDGLFVEDTHGFKHFVEENGLPSNHINSLRNIDGELYACTPLGAVKINAGMELEPAGPPETMTDIALDGDVFYFGTYDRGVTAPSGRAAHPLPGPIRVNRLIRRVHLWALTNSGARVLRDGRWITLVTPIRPERSLPGNHITSLAVDSLGRLWAGTFENGIAVIDAQGDIIKTIADETCREINHLSTDNSEGTVWAATNQGLLIFDMNFDRKRYVERDGLISSTVTHVLHNGSTKIISTASGITVMDGGEMKSYYVFHGLINNHAYTSAFFDGKTYIGTLGGISTLEDGAFTGNFTASGSGLRANWITALTTAQDRLFVGTYGGGVCELDRSGGINCLTPKNIEIEINFNALYFTGAHLAAGTLGRGLILFDTSEKKWFAPDLNVGSSNISAIASNADYLYIGSDSGLTAIDNINELQSMLKSVSWK